MSSHSVSVYLMFDFGPELHYSNVQNGNNAYFIELSWWLKWDNIITWSLGTDTLPCFFWHDCRLLFPSHTIQISALLFFLGSLCLGFWSKVSLFECVSFCVPRHWCLCVQLCISLYVLFSVFQNICVTFISFFLALCVCACVCVREKTSLLCACIFVTLSHSVCVVDLCAVWVCLTLHPCMCVCVCVCVCVCLQFSESLCVSLTCRWVSFCLCICHCVYVSVLLYFTLFLSFFKIFSLSNFYSLPFLFPSVSWSLPLCVFLLCMCLCRCICSFVHLIVLIFTHALLILFPTQPRYPVTFR